VADKVAHHFRCTGCGYDLYSTPLDGRCPECGKPVPKRKGLDKAKSPGRVNSGHRSRIRRAQIALWWAVPLTVIPLMICVAGFWFWIPGWLRWLSWIIAIASAISVLECYLDIQHHKERMVPEEGKSVTEESRDERGET
jgi:hypothetical protein